MSNNYIKSTTYSVTVSLEALERHLDNQLRDILRQELHVDSLVNAYVKASFETNGIVFYTMDIVK